MRDLEIRGAGNLLGDDQSGHVAAIGFELYVGMLDEAVAALAGTSADEAPEPVRMDIPVDAYVPGDYVPYEAAKIEIHRRVAGAKEIADLIVLREELEDRFGPVPAPLDNLLRLQDARIKLGRAGAKDVGFRSGQLTVSPIELDSTGSKALRAALPGAFFFSSRRRHTILSCDWSSDVCSSDLGGRRIIRSEENTSKLQSHDNLVTPLFRK